MVGLSRVVLYIVVLRLDSQFDELVLECSALLKEAMYLTVDSRTTIILSEFGKVKPNASSGYLPRTDPLLY